MSRERSSHTHLNSEEDVRGKVVLNWLAGLGFGSADIRVEHSFEVPLGRSRLKVNSGVPDKPGYLHPRADVLVRHVDGRNLLIVEVKAPGEPLDEAARTQGISYARLLQDGGIAPFVVLTNGTQTRIFDSISREELQGECIPQDHRHVRAGFRVTGDVLELRSDALEKLLSLNTSNLLSFCKAQVGFRMQRLRGKDSSSGRKYIPDLYIQRPESQKQLDKLLSQERRIILLIGPPQVGKTNLMCHTVERRLDDEQPTLFYPASAIDGLLGELREDFDWTFGQSANSQALMAERLSNVARAIGKKIVVFIDGWNEATIDAACSLDQHIARVSSEQVSFVISLTNVSAHRLLLDKVGNLSFVADETGLSIRDLSEIEWRRRPVPDEWGVVTIGDYNHEEMKSAYRRYSSLLKVKVPRSHQEVYEPLLLQTAMLAYQGRTLPKSLVAPELLEKVVDSKISRARLRNPSIGRPLLVATAEELFENGSPIREDRLLSRWHVPLSEGMHAGLFDAALLARRGKESSSEGIDFYSDRERDFVIAYWVRQWERLSQVALENLNEELERAVKTGPGEASIDWFLGLNANRDILKRSIDELGSKASRKVQDVLLRALRRRVHGMSDGAHLQLVQEASLKLIEGKFEALEAIAAVASDRDENYEFCDEIVFNDESMKRLLLLDSRFPLLEGMVGQPVLELLYGIHSQDDGWASFDADSAITRVLKRLAENSECKVAALRALGHVAPHVFFKWLKQRLPGQGALDVRDANAYLGAIENAADRMFDVLYTVFGREGGMVNVLRERELGDSDTEIQRHWQEYDEFKDLYQGVIHHFGWHPVGRRLQEYLDDLCPQEDRVVSK